MPIDLGRIFETIHASAPDEFRIAVRRPDDLLVFDLVFGNLRLAEDGPARLIRRDPGSSAFVVAEFPPQSFGEEAFLEVSGSTNPDDTTAAEPLPSSLPIARARMAGRSRVAFEMPADVPMLRYTLRDVLEAFRTWPMRLDVNAASDPDVALDRPWLTGVTESASWAAARAALTEGLGAGFEQPLDRAARRVGELAASELARGRTRGLDKRLADAMGAELEGLAKQRPQLREGQGRDLALAALALGATQGLAKSRRRFDFDPALLGRLPIFLIPFAPHEPSRSVTALELPYRLVLSPLAPARWRHSDEQVERRGRTELWHTRLSTGGDKTGPDLPSKVRAIWSPDYPLQADAINALLDPPKPFRMSLDPRERQMLVKLMAGFDEWIDERRRRPYTPRAGVANRLALSALGGLLDVQGSWSIRPRAVGLEQWRHLAALGRDCYVRVVTAGFACPFGHVISLVKVTERKFESRGPDPTRDRVAALRTRYFIVVREHVKHYDGTNHEFSGHTFPFTSVEILTQTTPNLTVPGAQNTKSRLVEVSGQPVYGGDVAGSDVFWPMVSANDDFRFDIAATDICGNRVTFSMPLLFVGDAPNDERAAAVRAAYDDPATVTRRTADLGGATVCFAEPIEDDPDPKGDPRLPTSSITFDAGKVISQSRFHANFYPEIDTAQVGIRAVQRLLGQPQAVVPVRYPDEYRKNAFAGANKGEVFLETVTDYALEFGGGTGQAKSDALGALATPSMAIQGLSRIMGPAADLGAVQSDSFNPVNFFKDAKILGGIPLSSLLTTVTGLAGDDVPKMLSRELPEGGGLPRRVEARFAWTTEITSSDPLGLFIPKADQVGTTTLEMSGVVTTPVDDPAAASYEASARIDNFKVNLFGFIMLWFDQLRFDAKSGQKPDVTVDLHDGDDAVTFGGPLEFVNELRRFIPGNGFSDPPGLSVTPSGMSASYSLNLPAVEVGRLRADERLARRGLRPAVRLAARVGPVQLLRARAPVQHHRLAARRRRLLSHRDRLGAASTRSRRRSSSARPLSIDLGVASGGVEIKAGIYFHWLEPIPNKGSVELAGYVRIHGELTVLAIISVSLTFNLQIGYLKDRAGNSIVYGEATLIVEIEILMFSDERLGQVPARVRRLGVGPELHRARCPSQAVWADYCDAFAKEAA